MKNNALCVMVLGTLILVGCGSKNDGNEKNLSEATNAYLVKKGQLCLGIATKWPVDLQDSDRSAGGVKASEMAALENVALVRSHETETEVTPLSGARPVKAKGECLVGSKRSNQLRSCPEIAFVVYRQRRCPQSLDHES